jgi:error-prone DNA polymerase
MDGSSSWRATMSYIELHCHSAFSLLDGASHPDALVERAIQLGYPALALTDHDDLGGIVAFSQTAHEHGLEAIVGAEMTVEVRDPGCGMWDAEEQFAPRATRHPPRAVTRPASPAPRPALSHLTLLAEDREGYGHLSTLITRARMDNPRGRPRVSLDVLAEHARGLYALTGCPLGWVPALVGRHDYDGACEALSTLLDIFDRRVAIECWDHGLPEERQVVEHLIEIADVFEIPWVVTNDVHYAKPEGRVVHDVLCCLKHEQTLDQMGTRLRPNGEWYLKSAEQMRLRWRSRPEGLRATLEIAERCAFRMKELEPTLPAFPLPPGVTADEYLARLVEQGARERWESVTEAAARQIAHELSIIRKLGLAGYFLIVWDIVRFARREGVLCQGRGSAANSAVCFCLGITAVDPIKLGLLFERFLSEERQEAPDIDIDFAHRDRELVLQYVYERYGREHAAMVCEQITYRGRSAVRDAARVLGFSVDQADTLSLLSDRFSARATAEAMEPRDARRGTRDAEAADSDGNPDAEAGVTPRLVESLGSHLVSGTEATNRKLAMRDAERRERRTEMDAARKKRPLTSTDRPLPNAAYEPYGSPSARDAGCGMRDVVRDQLEVVSARCPTEPPTVSGCPPPTSRIPHPASLLSHAGLDPADRRVRALPRIVRGMHNIPRHRSIHVGGFVLTEEPLCTVVPIEPASMADRTVVQWDKDDVEAMGLVKIDLLGLGMLTLIQDCLKYVRQTRGHTVDLARLDFTDQAVYDDLCAADTIGIFQVESRAQMNTLPRLKPRCFYDLVVEVALIRPGPIQGEMVHPYLRRKAGEEPVTYPHPSLEPILARTLGVPLFQEQGMQVAITAAGFTPGEADNLRRAMGHKRSRERMAAICEKLIEGMARNGIPEDTARRIYQQINAFADYGFPESHAASFALLVYASAYLKHYYAPEFTAAILNAQPMGFYSPGTLIEDARRHGVTVLPIDATKSGWDTTLEVRDAGCGMRDAERPSAPRATRHAPRATSRIPHPASRIPQSVSVSVSSADSAAKPRRSSSGHCAREGRSRPSAT